MESGGAFWRVVRVQDIVWLALFGALAAFGPDQNPYTVTFLLALGLFQVLESKLPLASVRGAIFSYSVKLILCYLLIGQSDGIGSSYYWVLFLPVISAATQLGLAGTAATSLIACGAYLSFWLRLTSDQFIPPDQVRELVLRVIVMASSGFVTHQLAEATRSEARRAEAAAEKLVEINRHLQEAEAAVRRSERLAALGQLSAGLAHELRNPLGTMKTSAEMLLKSVDGNNEVAREMAGFISSEVDRTNSLVTRFLDFARPLALRLEKADLTEVIDRAIGDIEKRSPALDIVIYKNYSPDIPPFYFDAQMMERVIYNLVLNAAQASRPGASVTVKTRQLGDTVEIAVIDRGSGIDPKHLENIFNPFFTTKSTGVGLGLAIVNKVIDEHGGKLAVESEAGAGSIFRVYLPFRETNGEGNA